MKFVLIIVFVSAAAMCQAQNYFCPVVYQAGMNMKFDQWFNVKDSVVLTKTQYKGKTDSLSYKRLPSTNPSMIYFSDGVMTQSLTVVPMPGTTKNIRHTHALTFKADIHQPAVSAVWYCSIIGP